MACWKQTFRFFLYQQYWLVFGSLDFIKMSKGWNDNPHICNLDLLMNIFYIAYNLKKILRAISFTEAFVRTCYLMSTETKYGWQTAHRPSATDPTWPSWARQWQTRASSWLMQLGSCLWGLFRYLILSVFRQPWHMAETWRYFPKIWLTSRPSFLLTVCNSLS